VKTEMSALSTLEQALENRWEALWARLAGKEPVELLDALRRECDANAVVVSERRVMVPNAYDVELADSVHDELTRRGSGVGQALTDSLARHAERRGYEWAGPLTVHIARSDQVPNGRYRVAGRIMPHVSAQGFQHPA
jgi:GNAT superfamily N-acetyltransferase